MLQGVFFLILAGLAARNSHFKSAPSENGTLKLSIVDEGSSKHIPARVEVLDKEGRAYVAEDAMSIEQPMVLLKKREFNPYTRTEQFYSDGTSRLSLPEGTYGLRIFKGIEYQMQMREVNIQNGKTTELTVRMSRWINLPEQGWYGADDHIHIPRPVKELDPAISKWMQAEDLHVANLLQFGHSKDFNQTIQYQHGPGGIYQEGNYILASGQENPRTDFLGHTVILGASSPIHFPDAYVIYKLFWEEAKRQGALSGYAHYGLYGGAEYGLSIDLPYGLLNFLEVLQADAGIYNVWYEILNLGLRMTPTAGSDYFPSETVKFLFPGRERFYTEVRGPLTYEAWLEGVRQGRTFVTNGPILELRVNEKGVGEEVVLRKPGSVQIEGAVRFDTARDNVKRLELITNGQLLRSFPRKGDSSEIHFQFQHQVKESCWLALRASGNKVGEAQLPQPNNAVSTNLVWSSAVSWGEAFYPPSVCHSAAIYVTLENSPALSAHARAKAAARAWLARLENLEERLTEDQIQYMTEPPPGFGDGVETDYLRKNRPALQKAIQISKKYFMDLAR